MSPAIRRHARRAGRWSWYLLAAILVTMAVVAGIASQLMPLAERHPERVAAWLSERAGRPVRFDALEAEWTRRGPLLRVDGLRVGADDDAVEIGAAEILVAQYAGLLPGRSLTELRLRDVHLELERRDDGSWHVHGLPGEGPGRDDPFAGLERLGEVQVLGGSLDLHAPELGIRTHVPRIDLRLQVERDRVRIAGRAWRVETHAPVQVALELSRSSGDGRVWAGIERAELDGWSPLLRYAGVAVAGGQGDVGAWITLTARRMVAARATVAFEGLTLKAVDATDAAEVQFQRLEADLDWRVTPGGWRLDAPRLRLGSADDVQSLDGIAMAMGVQQAVAAARVDLGPLLALLPLSDRLPDGVRTWLRDVQPGVVATDVAFARDPATGAMRIAARLDDLAFASRGEAPGMSGVAGTLKGDADGVVFTPDPRARWRFDWPAGFSAPHDIRLAGSIVAWHGDGGWEIATPALRVEGEGYAATVRGGLGFDADGSRPRIDLAAELDDAAVPVARRFWVRHRMPEAAVAWLDAALVDGRVRNGRAVVSGDLDDWPFRAAPGQPAPGLFQAEGDLAGAVLRFQPDWPAIDALEGHVRFVADGFEVSGHAAMAGVEIPEIEGGIASFADAELQVRAQAQSDVSAMFDMLRQTPLYEGLSALDELQAVGPARGRFAMTLPFGEGVPPQIDGEVDLDDVRVSERTWTLDLEQVNGTLRYDEHGFSAPTLRVRAEGGDGQLRLAAGEGHVEDPAQALEGALQADFAIAALLDRVDTLAWLRPHVDGRSGWTVGVRVPRTVQAGTAPAELSLRSDLRGTALALPAPLAKPADVPLPTEVRVGLPLEDGHEIVVALGDRLQVRARETPAGTGLGIALGGEAARPPPASGIVLAGRTDALDALEWAGLLAAGDGDGLPLRRIDLVADRLVLLGGTFPQTRIRAAPGAAGTELGFEGPALVGAVRLPEGGMPLVGRFERLYWQRPEAEGAPVAPAQAAALPQADPADDGIDPSRVPALQIDVTELRLGRARLGEASLRTRPVADGLQVDHLRAQGVDGRVDITGAWRGRGVDQRTQADVEIESGDYGALMAALGQGELLQGGNGRIDFEVDWRGSPANLDLASLSGHLALSIRDGQLVDVEPGAGRLLGLLSVAELPRRLMLDFRDFFDRGLAFNRMSGEVHFAGGQARGEGLTIDAPAAEIRIRGSADLRGQTYDQTIDVHPKSGNLLTAVGALTGGPIGAAVGAAANVVLRRPLGEIGATTYRVSGPWRDPEVEVIRREPQRAAGSRRQPAGDPAPSEPPVDATEP
ncbi:YhdP family protein [Luteimonas abyssi]|uniref:YhdP family protein n=1 Tax=Luteimonas abyssi TaxID=1247514 RepID=UPI000737BB4D|nr:YhdP family protein [Luteimonas abyssi]